MFKKMKTLRRTQRYDVVLNAHNRSTDPNDKVWEMWVEGAHQVVDGGSQRFAQTPSQAIAYKVHVEKCVWRHNNQVHHFDSNGRPVACRYRFIFKIV